MFYNRVEFVFSTHKIHKQRETIIIPKNWDDRTAEFPNFFQ